MSVTTRALFLVVLAVQMVTASQVQSPPRDGAGGRGRISGIVVGADTAPIAGATLTLQGSPVTNWKRLTATSDAGGRFVFAALPADAFHLEAAKDGYLKAEYGALRFRGEGTAIALADAQRISELTVTLQRGGVISGNVRDANGAAAPAVTLNLDPADAAGTAGFAQTDEAGRYRFDGVAPGEYHVLALPTDSESVPVYHPAATSFRQAARVRVGPADVRERIDISLVRTARTRLTGLVLDVGGRPAAGAMVFAIPGKGGGTRGDMGRETGPDGVFTYDGVFPGRYSVRAYLKAAPDAETYDLTTQWASEDVEVPAEGLPRLTIRMQPAIPFSGRVVFDGKTRPAPADLTAVRLELERSGWKPTPIDVRADGTFVRGVAPTPGQHALEAFVGDPAGVWSLRSAIVRGRDLLEDGVELSPGADFNDIVLTFTDRHNRLFGAVTGANAAPMPACYVIVFPADRARWTRPTWRRMTYRRPATDGQFSFDDLPAGDYLVATVPDLDPDLWRTPVFLEGLVDVSTRVRIAEGEQKKQDLRIVR